MSLDIKLEQIMFNWCVLKLKCNKRGRCDLFRAENKKKLAAFKVTDL